MLKKAFLPEKAHHHQVEYFYREGNSIVLWQVGKEALFGSMWQVFQVAALHKQFALVGHLLLKGFEKGGFARSVVPDNGYKGRSRYTKRKVADQSTRLITRNQIFYLNDQALLNYEL